MIRKLIKVLIFIFIIGCDNHHTPYKHPIVKDDKVVMELSCPKHFRLDVFQVKSIGIVQISCDPDLITLEKEK